MSLPEDQARALRETMRRASERYKGAAPETEPGQRFARAYTQMARARNGLVALARELEERVAEVDAAMGNITAHVLAVDPDAISRALGDAATTADDAIRIRELREYADNAKLFADPLEETNDAQ